MRQKIAKTLKRAVLIRKNAVNKQSWLAKIADTDSLEKRFYQPERRDGGVRPCTVYRPAGSPRLVYRQKKKLWVSTPWPKRADVFNIIKELR